MAKKMKVITILGTRPEIIRLSSVIKKLNAEVNHVLVHTGQNYDYELNQVFFDELGLRKPDYFLGVKAATLGEQLGNIISKSEDVLRKENPDALLILGDTNSALSIIIAKRLKIPIFHMEAGNRCFNPNVPEEINRRIVDHTADFNLCYTEHARLNLIREGLPQNKLFVTGSPLAEVLHDNKERIDKSKILETLALKKGKYIVASAHREENIDDDRRFQLLFESFNAIVKEFDMPIVLSTHPRTKKRLEEKGLKLDERVKVLKPFGFFDYVKLQKNAFVVLSDSGTISEESAMLNFPAIMTRTNSERPEAIDAGTMILGGVEKEVLIPAIYAITKYRKSDDEIPALYKNTDCSDRVLKMILGLSRLIDRRQNLVEY
ncbi:UDP-N-acetylglucosamine 2-epimerase (non-hydrolyzing) [Candidatus Woesearchaeota archaeon]|nr:UDP-N-acetylglucosamine 2-epimerase (non-hydrolyzing) [Candidatus Woesearchaeota archaeon]